MSPTGTRPGLTKTKRGCTIAATDWRTPLLLSTELDHTKPALSGKLVRTPRDVGEFLDWLDDEIRAGTPLAIDTETAGLDWWQRDHIRLWTVATEEYGWAIPMRWWGKIIEEAMHRIVRAGVRVIFHNATFDRLSMEADGLPVPAWENIEDTAILLALHRSDLPRGLKTPHVAGLLGPWVYSGNNELQAAFKRYFGKVDQGTGYTNIPIDDPDYVLYAILDTMVTARLWRVLEPVRTQFAGPYTRKKEAQRILANRERLGIRVDAAYAERLSEYLAKVARREAEYLRDLGVVDPGSRNSVLTLLEEQFGYEPMEFTATGQPALNKRVLDHLAKQDSVTADIANALIKYHKAVKWKATYADAVLTGMDVNGRIHPSMNVWGTRTGRYTSQRPNLYNLPGKAQGPEEAAIIRMLLLAEQGEKWAALDVSNQEPRILGHFGQGPALLDFLAKGEGSIHDYIAHRLFGAGYDPLQRGIAKIFGLSRSYGAGSRSMSISLGLPELQVKGLLGEYDELMGLANLNARIQRAAAERMPAPYVVTKGGRRQYAEPDKLFRLTNYLIQGSAADMMDDINIALDRAGYGDRILASIYDEVDLSVPAAAGDRNPMIEDMIEIMQDHDYRVPVIVDPPGKVGASWGHTLLPDGMKKNDLLTGV